MDLNKKPLPVKVGEEKFLQLNYANCRFMKSKRAFRTSYNPKNTWFTLKLEQGNDFETNKEIRMIHLHLRTPAEDRIYNEKEDLDIDIYIPDSEFNKIQEVIKNG